MLLFRFWQLQLSFSVLVWMFLGPNDNNLFLQEDFMLHHSATEIALQEHHQQQQRQQQDLNKPPLLRSKSSSKPKQLFRHSPPREEHPPSNIHIYVLTGPSMLGHGSDQDMMRLIQDHPETYGHLLNIDLPGWCEASDVYVVSDDVDNGTTFLASNQRRARPLTMGLGVNASTFGPELGFGWALKRGQKENMVPLTQQQLMPQQPTILLIKAAWNSESHALDSPPPLTGLRQDLTNEKGEPLLPESYNVGYPHVMDRVSATLHNLPELLPEHFTPDHDTVATNPGTDNSAVSFKGLVWLQDNHRLPESFLAKERQSLLRLIQDVRHKWKAPNLPVVIGGVGGQLQLDKEDQHAHLQSVQEQEEDTARPTPFTRFVETTISGQRLGKGPFGDAEAIYEMGRTLGNAMLELQKQESFGPRGPIWQ